MRATFGQMTKRPLKNPVILMGKLYHSLALKIYKVYIGTGVLRLKYNFPKYIRSDLGTKLTTFLQVTGGFPSKLYPPFFLCVAVKHGSR